MATDNSPLIFLMGVTGQTGRYILEDFDKNPGNARIRIGVRKQKDLERFRNEGRDAVLFDLDDPRTFGPALCGVDRLNILTGYTIAMTHQTKTLVDAAKKAGVKHIVNQGVFANDDCTDSKFSWFALVECYIEASGIPWTHLHPNMFMDGMLNVSPPTARPCRWLLKASALMPMVGPLVNGVGATVHVRPRFRDVKTRACAATPDPNQAADPDV